MYPLKFKPVYQERIWGGARLAKVLGKVLPPELAGKPVGESWELADLSAGTVQKDSAGAAADGSLSSVITNGEWKGRSLHQVIEETQNSKLKTQNGEESHPIMGRAQLHNGAFPLLVKFLDARTDLSVQVHPDAEYCARHPGANLKSEAWYILHAEPGAKIYKGVKPGVTKEAFRAALEEKGGGGVESLLRAYKARAGDCHYLPSGTVHALGAGILAAEVQTPSDTTFRVFDWNRLGPDGKPRALHVTEALETIHFGPTDLEGGAVGGVRSHVAGVFSTVSRLVTCEFFTLERVRMVQGFEQEVPYSEPVVWMVLEGQGVITCDSPGAGAITAFAKGETLLLPAKLKNAKVKAVTDCAWLEAKLPGGAIELT